MELNELKEKFEQLSKKYKIPSFNEINQNFEIEKIDRESDILLRVVRKVMMEKVINALGFAEMLLNPMNVPRMYINYARSMTSDDKSMIDKIYDSLAILSLDALDNETEYSEKNEAELIKKIFETWISIQPQFKKILVNMKKPVTNSVKKEKSYYG